MTAAAALAAAFLAGVPAFASPGHGKESAGQTQGGDVADGHMGGGHMSGDHHGFAFGMKGKAADVSRTIDVAMHDVYYEPKQITVKAGETVRFRVHNKGSLVHEFSIGTANMHADHQKEMQEMMDQGMLTSDRINFAMMKEGHGRQGMKMAHDDPNTVMLEPGKSGEVIWTFTKPMKLEFACNIPGHYESGMVGQFQFK